MTTEAEKMTDEEASALLKKLSQHFGQPVLPMNRYCDALRTWASCIEEMNMSGRGPSPNEDDEDEDFPGNRGKYQDRDIRGSEYAPFIGGILRDISKSSLLARLLYDGEKFRTRPCPKHKGIWSGIDDCPYGCGDTGWLQEPEERPTKQRLEEVIKSAETGLAKERLRRGDEYESYFFKNQIEACQGMLAYLHPDVPGTGIDAPVVPENILVVSLEGSFDRKPFLTQSVTLLVRFDIDPQLRIGGDKGENVRMPAEAVLASLALTRSLMVKLAPTLKVYDIEAPRVADDGPALHSTHCGRSGITLTYGSSFTKLSHDTFAKMADEIAAIVNATVAETPIPTVTVRYRVKSPYNR